MLTLKYTLVSAYPESSALSTLFNSSLVKGLPLHVPWNTINKVPSVTQGSIQHCFALRNEAFISSSGFLVRKCISVPPESMEMIGHYSKMLGWMHWGSEHAAPAAVQGMQLQGPSVPVDLPAKASCPAHTACMQARTSYLPLLGVRSSLTHLLVNLHYTKTLNTICFFLWQFSGSNQEYS